MQMVIFFFCLTGLLLLEKPFRDSDIQESKTKLVKDSLGQWNEEVTRKGEQPIAFQNKSGEASNEADR